MNARVSIFNRLNILCVEYNSTGGHTVRRYLSCGKELRRKELPYDSTYPMKESKYPSVVVLSGYGVISKPAEAGEVAEMVTSDPDSFLWNYTPDGKSITFVRRSRVESLLATFETVNQFKVIRIECLCGMNDTNRERILDENIPRLRRTLFSFRNIFSFTDAGSLICRMLFDRLKLYVLAALFFILMLNFLIDGSLGRELSDRQNELAGLRKAKGTQEKNLSIRQKTLAEYDVAHAHRYGLICDGIGSVVPDAIVLTCLGVQPITKQLENGKRPAISHNLISIEGEADSAERVSTFISAIQKLPFASEVTLRSLDKPAGASHCLFTITVTL